MPQTMEQQRAADAWERTRHCSDEYMKLAKGLPALIMNSGLMQVMAFLQEKGEKGAHYRDLARDLRRWLGQRFPQEIGSDQFVPFMEALMTSDDPRTYQQVTAEAFSWLRWARQMAPASRAGRD